MATFQQAASSGSAAAIGGTTNAIGQTIVGLHVWKIDRFSATKDLGVGKSIKSSTFNVGGHGWYMECYPCRVDEDSGGWVSLFLCLSLHKEEQVQGGCEFHGMEDDECHLMCITSRHTFNADTLWRCGSTHMRKRENLESRLEGDCFQVRCVVYVAKEFPAVPPPDLHRPLSDLLASGMPGDLTTFQVGGELFTLHRGLPGPSALVAASTTSAGATTAARISADIDNVAGSHVLTIDGYSNAKKLLFRGESLNSEHFIVGGRRWYLELYPSGKDENDTDCLAVFLCLEDEDEDFVVKVRFQLTLLNLAREIMASTQFCCAFTYANDAFRCSFPFTTEPQPQSSLLLGDSFHVRCDVTIVNEVTPMHLSGLHLHFGSLLASQVGTDVTFDVSGDLFPAHKCVLATRSTAFMAEFFGPAAKGSSATATRVQIDDMEPRVFKALLHFIYTDALPEVRDDDDKIGMAQGLLVAADRYAMERLKLICADMLCSYVNDARTAVDTLELADKHGCRRLKEACMKLLKGHFAKVTP